MIVAFDKEYSGHGSFPLVPRKPRPFKSPIGFKVPRSGLQISGGLTRVVFHGLGCNRRVAALQLNSSEKPVRLRGSPLIASMAHFQACNLFAAFRHLISDDSSNGLVRKPSAPALTARFLSLSFGKAVIKIIGMQHPCDRSASCSSRPFNPGICRSVIRHAVAAVASDSRKCSAEMKVRAS